MIDRLIRAVIAREGGYVHHPQDRGGATAWGITERVARAHGHDGSMRLLTRDAAADIYRRVYWDAPGFDQIALRSMGVAAELFDTGVNMGTATATGFLQRALNALNRQGRDYPDVVVDRVVGPRTLHALDGLKAARGRQGMVVLVRALEALQGERYIALAERRAGQEAFVYGWLANRIGSLTGTSAEVGA